jgi:6-phosphogluconate dehydrogenase
MGISGGEKGARYGPSMMPGGPKDAYERVREVFESAAAKVDGTPCITYLGPGSAGHYVKMVHNGIEYGLIELLAEAYDLMKRGLGVNNDELHAVFEKWNGTELNSFLVEITAAIFRQEDEKTGRRLIDVILDEAKQKGTGKWTCQDAMDLQVPIPTIDMAVAMRDLSIYKDERQAVGSVFTRPGLHVFKGDREVFKERLHRALYAAMIVTYAQGMSLLRKASAAYEYNTSLEDVARIWRGGCIIRAALLDRILAAYKRRSDLPNILLDPDLGGRVIACQEDLRSVSMTAADLGIPAPALMASLAYVDGYRSEWLPANLIQAQRDYFGAHTYERVDGKGTFHTHWGED